MFSSESFQSLTATIFGFILDTWHKLLYIINMCSYLVNYIEAHSIFCQISIFKFSSFYTLELNKIPRIPWSKKVLCLMYLLMFTSISLAKNQKIVLSYLDNSALLYDIVFLLCPYLQSLVVENISVFLRIQHLNTYETFGSDDWDFNCKLKTFKLRTLNTF